MPRPNNPDTRGLVRGRRKGGGEARPLHDERARRIIRFQEWPKQEEFSRAIKSGKYRYLAYGGAIGGGKSGGTLNDIQALAMAFPRSRWAIVRKDLPTIKRTTIPSFDRIRVTNFTGELNRNDWTYYCGNGSEILYFPESLQSDPSYSRWLGLEVNGFLYEQAEELARGTFDIGKQRAGRWIIPPTDEQQERIYEEIDRILEEGDPEIARIRKEIESSDLRSANDHAIAHELARQRYGPRQPPPLILLTFNPDDGWIREVFYDPWQEGRLKEPYYYLPATARDNPALPKDYIEALEATKETDPQGYARFVLGIWGAISQPDQLIQLDWVLGARKVEFEAGPRRLGVDVARFGDDDTVFTLYEGNDLFQVFRYHHMSEPETARRAAAIITEFDIPHHNVNIDAVGPGGGVVSILHEDGYEVRAFNGGSSAVPRDEAGFYSFKNKRIQSWWEFREKLRRGDLRISLDTHSEEWRRLTKDLTAPKYKISGDRSIDIEPKLKTKTRLKRSPDFGDSAVMGDFEMPEDLGDDVISPSYTQSTW